MGLHPRRAVVVALSLTLLAACGRRGDPLPPLRDGSAPPPRVLNTLRVDDAVLWRLGEPATATTWLSETVAATAFYCHDDLVGVTAPTTVWRQWPGEWLQGAGAAATSYVRLLSADGRSGAWAYVPAATTVAPPAVTAAVTTDGRVTLKAPHGASFWLVEAVGNTWIWRARAVTAVERGPYPPGSRVRFFAVAVSAEGSGWAAHPVTQPILLEIP